MSEKLCPCGQPLHYSSPFVQGVVEGYVSKQGENIPISTPYGTWLVSRHYIALHGFNTEELPQVAEKYGFQKVLDS
jgi:hypothetical protein